MNKIYEVFSSSTGFVLTHVISNDSTGTLKNIKQNKKTNKLLLKDSYLFFKSTSFILNPSRCNNLIPLNDAMFSACCFESPLPKQTYTYK